MKRLFATILALALAFSLLPATASAAPATSVIVAGVELGSGTDVYYWKNGGATASSSDYNAYFDAATGTLTLKNADIVGVLMNEPAVGSNCGIYSATGNELTIVLEGANTVTAGDPDPTNNYAQSNAIFARGILRIKGDGSLDAKSTSSGFASYGVRSSMALHIEGGTVTATGGTATGNEGSGGVYGTSITITDSTVTATGGTGTNGSYGLRGTPFGSITITNSTVTAKTTSATGTKRAMSQPPVFMGVQRQGSTASDGSNPVTYDSASNNSYMWVKTVPVVDVGFTDLTANGSPTQTTTALTLTFDKDVPGLTENDITLTGATKGTLTGAAGQYTLTISDITVASGENVTVAVAKTGFAFTPASQTVAVHVYAPPTITITPSGSAVFPQGAATGNAVFTVDSNLPRFNAVDHFHSATLDGAPLDLGEPSGPGTPGTPGTDGSVATGSIVLTINQAKLNTLAAGDHPLVVTLQGAFWGRTVSGVIRVLGPGGDTGGGGDPGALGDVGPDIPETGDGATPLVWLGLLVCAGAGLIASRRKRRA